ncbi:MAG: phenylalanine--tRNA ligase subunit beta [Phycisphaerales bacterium]
MLASVRWLNRYLEPSDLTADEALEVLERSSFPIESREDLGGGDARLDVELTSNRGDAFAHVALAREIAVVTGRRLVVPEALRGGGGDGGKGGAGPGGRGAESITSVEVAPEVGSACPRFTARVIEGVKVGPSPAWVREALESVGQRSINSIVDVTNFVLMECGHPSHAFDLDALAGGRLVVRWARDGETLAGLDGRTHTLRGDELVVADGERAQSLAGVVGGTATGVTEKTTRVLLEVATWDPVVIRRAARRLQIFTDAAYRFERVVDARDIPAASDRLVELILEVAGGQAAEGMIDVRGELPARRVIELRPERCDRVLGMVVPRDEMRRVLEGMGFGVEGVTIGGAPGFRCAVPHNRTHDVQREIDVIEEVGRLHGIDHVEVSAALPVRFDFDHPAAWDRRERSLSLIGQVLTGHGFYETVTFSFASESVARGFMPPGLRAIKVDEQRRREMPYLRPSIVPGLLEVRKANQDGRVVRAGGIRLYEVASVFGEEDDGAAAGRKTVERRNVGLLLDVEGASGKGSKRAEALQAGFRAMRGAIEQMARALGGGETKVELRESEAFCPLLAGETVAGVSINGEHAGYVATMTGEGLAAFGVSQPVVVGEVGLDALVGLYPAASRVRAVPAFPSIERDLSVIVDEGVAWGAIAERVESLGLEHFEGVSFVGTFRGEQVGAGRKSVTLRITFRDPARTLRHEEADGSMERATAALVEGFGGEVRR